MRKTFTLSSLQLEALRALKEHGPYASRLEFVTDVRLRVNAGWHAVEQAIAFLASEAMVEQRAHDGRFRYRLTGRGLFAVLDPKRRVQSVTDPMPILPKRPGRYERSGPKR